MPSCLGGGDLDGDPYNLIIDVRTFSYTMWARYSHSLKPNLFPPKGYTSTPGSYIGLPYKETRHQCTVEDVADFVIDYVIEPLLFLRYKQADLYTCISNR